MDGFALKVCARPRFETEAEIKFEVAQQQQPLIYKNSSRNRHV